MRPERAPPKTPKRIQDRHSEPQMQPPTPTGGGGGRRIRDSSCLFLGEGASFDGSVGSFRPHSRLSLVVFGSSFGGLFRSLLAQSRQHSPFKMLVFRARLGRFSASFEASSGRIHASKCPFWGLVLASLGDSVRPPSAWWRGVGPGSSDPLHPPPPSAWWPD